MTAVLSVRTDCMEGGGPVRVLVPLCSDSSVAGPIGVGWVGEEVRGLSCLVE